MCSFQTSPCSVSFLGENSVCPHEERERGGGLIGWDPYREADATDDRDCRMWREGSHAHRMSAHFCYFYSHSSSQKSADYTTYVFCLVGNLRLCRGCKSCMIDPHRGKSHNSYDFLWAGRTDRVKWRQAATTHLELGAVKNRLPAPAEGVGQCTQFRVFHCCMFFGLTSRQANGS